MTVPNETLRAIIRDFGGFELSDEEFDLVRPEIDGYLAEMKNMEDLDLSAVFSSRLVQLPVDLSGQGRTGDA